MTGYPFLGVPHMWGIKVVGIVKTEYYFIAIYIVFCGGGGGCSGERGEKYA